MIPLQHQYIACDIIEIFTRQEATLPKSKQAKHNINVWFMVGREWVSPIDASCFGLGQVEEANRENEAEEPSSLPTQPSRDRGPYTDAGAAMLDEGASRAAHGRRVLNPLVSMGGNWDVRGKQRGVGSWRI
jgi:hypothetical protein